MKLAAIHTEHQQQLVLLSSLSTLSDTDCDNDLSTTILQRKQCSLLGSTPISQHL